MTFGERLRELRQDNDETQKQIGDLLNIGARMISHYEKDEHFPRDYKSIIILAEHFNVTIDYLFGITNIKEPVNESIVLSSFYGLNNENQKEALNYMRYLHYKQNNK